MVYATTQDLVDRFGVAEIAASNPDQNAPLNAIDEERVALMIAQASSEIDSYFQRRYQLPLSLPLPLSVTSCCCKLARYYLACSGTNTPSEQIIKDRDDARKWLLDIGMGRATLDVQEKKETTNSFSRFQSRPSPLCHGGLH